MFEGAAQYGREATEVGLQTIHMSHIAIHRQEARRDERWEDAQPIRSRISAHGIMSPTAGGGVLPPR